MSVFSPLWSRRDKGTRSDRLSEVTLDELDAQNYEIVRVINDVPGQEFAIAAPRSSSIGSQGAIEFGSSSPSPFTSWVRQEYNPNLRGIEGLKNFDKMRKSDGTVRGTLRAYKIPALAGRWYNQYYCDENASDRQNKVWKEQSDWVWHNLQNLMTISWTQVITEALLMVDFGYYMFECVWENRVVDGKLRTVLTKLAPRHPMDVKEWVFDSHGGPLGVIMYTEVSDIHPLGEVAIPIDKLLVFSFDREGGDITGVSVLRSAYQHWYYKTQLYKIDAIQKERHGIGIPVIKLPLGYKKGKDDVVAEELGRNIRTNERAHIVLPPGWEVSMLKLEGQPVDPMISIEHHDDAIRENMLVNFIASGAREDDLVMFMKAARFLADIMAETFSLYLYPKMVTYNWPLEEHFPKLKVRRVGESADWRTLSFAIRNLIGAGALIPDKPLEENLREEMDLPEIDEETSRLIATPQNPYDVNDQTDQGAPGAPNDIHNNQNPNYDRGSKAQQRIQRKKRSAKQRGARVGLPRQASIPAQRGPTRTGTGDRSGG